MFFSLTPKVRENIHIIPVFIFIIIPYLNFESFPSLSHLISLFFSLGGFQFFVFFFSYSSGNLVMCFLKVEDSETNSPSSILIHTEVICLYLQIRNKSCLKKKGKKKERKGCLLQCGWNFPDLNCFRNREKRHKQQCKHGCQQYHPKYFPYGQCVSTKQFLFKQRNVKLQKDAAKILQNATGLHT